MFKNPGRTLKIVSKILFGIGVITSIIVGIFWVADYEDFGWVFILCSFPAAFIIFLPLIAFGQLCEDTSEIRKKIAPDENEETNK